MNKVKLFEKQKYTLYELQKKIGLSRNWLYDYAKGRYNVEKMPINVVLKIAQIEGIEPNKLYKMMIDYRDRKDK